MSLLQNQAKLHSLEEQKWNSRVAQQADELRKKTLRLQELEGQLVTEVEEYGELASQLGDANTRAKMCEEELARLAKRFDAAEAGLVESVKRGRQLEQDLVAAQDRAEQLSKWIAGQIADDKGAIANVRESMSTRFVAPSGETGRSSQAAVVALASRIHEWVRFRMAEMSGLNCREALLSVAGALLDSSRILDLARGIQSDLDEHSSQVFTVSGTTMSFGDAIQAIAARKTNGVLSVKGLDHALDIHLSSGRVVFLNPVRIGEETYRYELFHHDAHLSSEFVAESIGRLDGPGESVFLDALAAGVLQADQVPDVMEAFSTDVLCRCLKTPAGCVFTFTPESQYPPAFVPISVSIEVTRFLLRIFAALDEWSTFERVVPGPEAVFERTPGLSDWDTGSFREEHGRVLEAIDGCRTVRDVILRARMNAFLVFRTLYTLVSLGRIRPVNGDRMGEEGSDLEEMTEDFDGQAVR